jgi:H+-transporting ATPase
MFFLAFCTTIIAIGQFKLRLSVSEVQTLAVVAIIYGSQAMMYAIRERRHLWGLRPTLWVILSSVADLTIISTLAVRGIAMAPLPFSIVACEFAVALVFAVILNGVKIPVFARLSISYHVSAMLMQEDRGACRSFHPFGRIYSYSLSQGHQVR